MIYNFGVTTSNLSFVFVSFEMTTVWQTSLVDETRNKSSNKIGESAPTPSRTTTDTRAKDTELDGRLGKIFFDG